MKLARYVGLGIATIVIACNPEAVTITQAEYQEIVGEIFIDMPSVSELDTLYVDLPSFLTPPIELNGQIQAEDIDSLLPLNSRIVPEKTTMSCVSGNDSSSIDNDSSCPLTGSVAGRLVALQDMTRQGDHINIKLWWIVWHWPDSRCVARAEYSFEFDEKEWKEVDMFYPVC